MKLLNNKSLTVAAIRVAGAGLSFLLVLAVSRLTGANGSGIYYTITGLITLVSIFIALGDQHRLLRYVSQKPTEGKLLFSRYIQQYSIRFLVIVSISAPVAVYLVDQGDHTSVLVAGGALLSAFLMVLIQAGGVLFNGKDQQHWAAVYTTVSIPVSMLLLAPIFIANSATTLNITLWFCISYGVIVCAAYLHIRPTLSSPQFLNTEVKPNPDTIKIFASLLLTYLNNWLSTYLVLYFGSLTDVSVFNTVLRITLLEAIISSVFAAIYAPQFSNTNSSIDLQQKVFKNTRGSLLMGVVALSPLLIFPKSALGLFGAEFVFGHDALTVLIFFKLARLSMGSVGYLLLMKGQYKEHLLGVTTGVIFQVIAGLILIPSNPVLGATVTIGMGLVIEGATQAILAKRRLNLICFITPFYHKASACK